MNLNVQIPPNPERNAVDRRYTGFPEPLSPNSNTTLRHPDADTSQNASIEAADIPLSRVQSRVRIPGLHRKTQSVSTTFGKSDLEFSRPATSLSSTQSKDDTGTADSTPTKGNLVNGVNGLTNGFMQGDKTPEKRHWFRKSVGKVN